MAATQVLQGREYFAHKFAPGSYKFVAWAENAQMLQAELAPGRIYDVLLSVRMEVWTARMSISALTPQRQEWASLGKWMEASRQLVADVERAPLSANVSETLTPFAITVGRWKVTNDDRREGTHDIERVFGPHRGG